MLVLGRKIGQSIVINGNIVITLLAENRGRFRIGIEAPDGVTIWRQEIEPHVPDPTLTPAT